MPVLGAEEIIARKLDVNFFFRPNNRYTELRVTEFNREQCAMF
jgi:hypothetical protein